VLLRLAFFVVVSVAVAAAACRPAAPQSAQRAPYVKIWIAQNGAVQLDGKPAELSGVEDALAKKPGVVLYGREGAQGEPHVNALKVIQMVVDNKLPIRMSTKPDFSDVIGPDGKLKK
jgi:hypothetical protein